jgi:chemotaxis signal transduction protein
MLDLQLDGDDAVLAPAFEAQAPSAAPAAKQLAQGVLCGDLPLAFNFDWARQIVDQFDLVPVPRAPSWVLGAVNVNGLIVPVVDLANYFSNASTPAQLQRGQRLLVGGVQAEDAESALALVFSQTPVQLEYTPQPLADLQNLPARLQEVCRGHASDDQGRLFIEIDPDRLMDALSAELSVI